MSLVNKVAIVTGASSGIGVIAVKLALEKARVAIVGRNEGRLKNVSEACEKIGVKPLTIVADVSKDDEVKKIVSSTFKSFRKIDILVNSAGIGLSAAITDDEAMEVFDKIISNNLRSSVNLTHLVAKHLIESKGKIINISSIASQGGLGNRIFTYASAKAALDHFTRCVALELAPDVRVNVINPGPVRTDIFQHMGIQGDMEKQVWESMKKGTALNRVADPEEIADLVAFLVSDKARSITGSSIVTDNGLLLMIQRWSKALKNTH